MNKLILILSIWGYVFNLLTTTEKQFDEYKGGRYGFSGVTLKLYCDSTYYFSEWNHTGRSIKDIGRWGKINDNFYLVSDSKTKWSLRWGKEYSKKTYRFTMQEFKIIGDTLKFIPKDSTDNDYYDEYYSLYKVIKTNQ